MSIKIRVMGSETECAAFAAMIRQSVPEKHIRNISHFYPNRRAGQFSTEGRIYLEFVEFETGAPEIARRGGE